MQVFRCFVIIFFIGIGCCHLDASRESTYVTEKQSAIENYKKGIAADDAGNYNEALDYLLLFIKDAETDDNRAIFENSYELSYAYLIVGNLHLAFFDYGASLKYYKIGYSKSLQVGNRDLQSYFLNNMTVVCCFLKRFNEAQRYNEAMRRMKGINVGKQKHSYALNNGFVAKGRGEWRKAIDYFCASARLVDEYHLGEYLKGSPYSEVYPIYEEQGDLDSALYYLKKYNEIAVRDKSPNMLVDSYKGLMRMYTKMGDKEKALKYQDIYVRLSDSLLNTNEFLRIKNDYVEFEDNITGKEIENLQGTVSMQKMAIAVYTVVVFLIVSAIVIIYRQKRSLRKSYSALFERNRELVEMERLYKQEIQQSKELKDDTPDDPQPKVTDTRMIKEIAEKIISVMDDSDVWCNSDFNLAELSKLVGSNTSYVSEAINDVFGKNFRSFINEYRIKEARKRMTDVKTYGNYTIQGIASSVGFKSATNFGIAFKKITGITPSLYQKIAKQEKTD